MCSEQMQMQVQVGKAPERFTWHLFYSRGFDSYGGLEIERWITHILFLAAFACSYLVNSLCMSLEINLTWPYVPYNVICM